MANRAFNLLASLVSLAAVPAVAHHAFSREFDESKTVVLRGVVTRIDWQNPHVFFYVDVKDGDGRAVNWACETRGPRGLARGGWTRDSLKPGDKVIVQGFLARDGSHKADGRKVTLADGRKILSSD